jgi:hypothetical protein
MIHHEPWSLGSTPPVTLEHGAAIPPPVLAFLQRLKRLPLGVWADVAFTRTARPTDVTLSQGSPSSLADARARLRKLIDTRPAVAARIRPRVYELAGVAQAFLHPAVVARMKKVGLAASLALAVRDHLAEEDFEQLYAPFAELIPIKELAGEM